LGAPEAVDRGGDKRTNKAMAWLPTKEMWPRQPLMELTGEALERAGGPDTLEGKQGCWNFRRKDLRGERQN